MRKSQSNDMTRSRRSLVCAMYVCIPRNDDFPPSPLSIYVCMVCRQLYMYVSVCMCLTRVRVSLPFSWSDTDTGTPEVKVWKRKKEERHSDWFSYFLLFLGFGFSFFFPFRLMGCVTKKKKLKRKEKKVKRQEKEFPFHITKSKCFLCSLSLSRLLVPFPLPWSHEPSGLGWNRKLRREWEERKKESSRKKSSSPFLHIYIGHRCLAYIRICLKRPNLMTVGWRLRRECEVNYQFHFPTWEFLPVSFIHSSMNSYHAYGTHLTLFHKIEIELWSYRSRS